MALYSHIIDFTCSPKANIVITVGDASRGVQRQAQRSIQTGGGLAELITNLSLSTCFHLLFLCLAKPGVNFGQQWLSFCYFLISHFKNSAQYIFQATYSVEKSNNVE